MGWKRTHYILLMCYVNLCWTSSILPPSTQPTSSTANTNFDRPNDLASNESTISDSLQHQDNISELGIKNNGENDSPDTDVTGIQSIDLKDEEEDPSTLNNLTSIGNLTTLSIHNSTQYKLWQHLTTFSNYVICQFYQGDDYIKTGVKTYFGGHKLLTMFLGMIGVLACLLILIYCIYIRQHKEEMFSHHRLYGEGFEDPVLHLDTPVDHLDFFSFRDTELTPAPTPKHKCHQTETSDTKGDYKVDVPKGTSSNELLHQIIQMSSIKHS